MVTRLWSYFKFIKTFSIQKNKYLFARICNPSEQGKLEELLGEVEIL